MSAVAPLPKFDPIYQTALDVLDNESRGLIALKTTIDHSFLETVETISACTGRVILSGMGKCNHIANKIAATLASTGQPAFFVHPAEAGHGDLGMICENDVVLMLSYSGETTELANLIAYTRRFSIPLIAIVGRPQSTLAQMATHVLCLPRVEEACPLQLAPTTSTTMMLALGDALAICLLTKKGFTPQDFKVYHPGGNLGNQLTRVGEKMHGVERLPLVLTSCSMQDVLIVISEKGFGCAGVIDETGRLTGIITDGDLRRHMNPNLLEKTAGDVMTTAPRTTTADILLGEVVRVLNDRKITGIFVVDGEKKPLGFIHIHDCLRLGLTSG